MLSFVADENFRREIVLGLRLRRPDLDVVRVQDVGLRTADDPDILDWASRAGRLVLTHDASTMPDLAYARVARGEPMPGVCVVPDDLPTREAIDEIEVLAMCSHDREWVGRVVYVPL